MTTKSGARRTAAAPRNRQGADAATTPGWEAAKRDADLVLWLPGDVPMYFRLIPPTDQRGFVMGEERGNFAWAQPRHRVRITRSFYLSTFPVTQGQYRAVPSHAIALNLDPSPSHFTDQASDGASGSIELRPVEQVSWNDAVRWCAWLLDHQGKKPLRWESSRDRVAPFEHIGLPTEAQWEYACRAGSKTAYSNGDRAAELEGVGWFDKNSGGSTHPVGCKAANDFGLYDMHGNVWEWCRDAWAVAAYSWPVRYYDGCADPEVTAAQVCMRNPDRVVRGGSWGITGGDCRSAIRFGWRPGLRDRDLGFRVCLFPGPAALPAV